MQSVYIDDYPVGKQKTDARGETSPSLAADPDLAAERRDAIETLAESTVDAFASDVPMSFRDEIRGGTRARGGGLEGPEEGRSGRDPEGVAESPTSLAAKLASLKDEWNHWATPFAPPGG